MHYDYHYIYHISIYIPYIFKYVKLTYIVSNNVYNFYSFVLASETVTCEFPVQQVMSAEKKKARKNIDFIVSMLSSFKFHVRFSFERSGLMLTHQALKTIMNTPYLQQLIFPCNHIYFSQTALLPPYVDDKNDTISSGGIDSYLNDEQKRAAKSIVNIFNQRQQNPSFVLPPFIIFGPPGTGKTLTIVASVLEIHKYDPGTRILLCAPSDAAADVICKRCKEYYGPDKMLRFNWWQRTVASVHSDILIYTYQTDNGFFDIPRPDLMSQFKIIVSTCGTAGILRGITDLFDVVIVDESSQALEAEVLVPISLCKEGGVVVIAGDTEQLNAAPRSPLFSYVEGYHSIQDRLLKMPFYSDIKSQYDSSNVNSMVFGAFLRRNYRSHRDIYATSSKLFYSGALIESGKTEVINSLTRWKYQDPNTETTSDVLETSDFYNQSSPCHFVGVNGTHSHEVDSPSFFNTLEISKVVDICKDLCSSKLVDVTERDIGVIGAFRSQVLKIRKGLREVGLGKINVGSVQDFQGQEVKVVIISTVLTSSVCLTSKTTRETFGLIGDHRKFNVSLTRAKALAIVVGEPYTLYSDPSWKEYLEFCDRNGRYNGTECLLLSRHHKSSEVRDADELLNTIAQVAMRNNEQMLGIGCALAEKKYQYFNDEVTWRTLL